MKCPACGRGMLRRETYFECSNILCDYEEDVENEDLLAKPEQISWSILLDSVKGLEMG